MVWEGKEAASMETQAAIYCRLSQDDGSLGESGSCLLYTSDAADE